MLAFCQKTFPKGIFSDNIKIDTKNLKNFPKIQKGVRILYHALTVPQRFLKFLTLEKIPFSLFNSVGKIPSGDIPYRV